jgi:hypothetical protein
VFFLTAEELGACPVCDSGVSGLLFLVVYVQVLLTIQSPHIFLYQTEKGTKNGIDVKFILNVSLFKIFCSVIIFILFCFPIMIHICRNSKGFEDILQEQFCHLFPSSVTTSVQSSCS